MTGPEGLVVLSSIPARALIALIDGDATIRHARQLMLRAEVSYVRAYPNCAAALADPAAMSERLYIAVGRSRARAA